jgi:hypothetical protein
MHVRQGRVKADGAAVSPAARDDRRHREQQQDSRRNDPGTSD